MYYTVELLVECEIHVLTDKNNQARDGFLESENLRQGSGQIGFQLETSKLCFCARPGVRTVYFSLLKGITFTAYSFTTCK